MKQVRELLNAGMVVLGKEISVLNGMGPKMPHGDVS